ncbi:MAG: alanine--tRNA ligase [Balneolales bacterium]
MSHKTSAQIRNDFFQFFESKQHIIVNSAPVVPQDDPTLLFTNAGMNQFKPIFLGEQEGYKDHSKIRKRVANTQRCIRVSGKHNDLEEVGHDTYHHTLFEMLGNWSFGDYFKEEAIEWGWELLTKVWKIDPSRLYATVFAGDDQDGLPTDEEAIELWKSKTNINHEHILKCGKKDNFWEMGEVGPCGPCSEIHVDLRPDEEREKQPGYKLVNKDDPRVMEIWNLVFIQYNRQKDHTLVTLPAQHVDTGMGFERIVAVLQGKTSNYDTDVFLPVIKQVGKLAKKSYGESENLDIAMRVIADHIRAVSFSIADGASPGNDGRGYVIRRILRRAVRYGWDSLGLKEPFMHKLVDVLAEQFRTVFPELDAQKAYVKNVIEAEEKSFIRTLGQGIQLFQNMMEGKTKLPGEDAFMLHDTYGFPIDLTALMAREQGKEVDIARFDELMLEQKERARSAGKFGIAEAGQDEWTYLNGRENETEFIGYDNLETEATITAYRRSETQPAIILDKTPFYAESGGQVGDIGLIRSANEHLRVLDVKKADGRFIHYVDHLPDNPQGEWQAIVDQERRLEVQKNHTATHLLHAALREILGSHVGQKGSLVENERLRFDFSHYEAIEPAILNQIEELVNQKIQQNIPLLEERGIPIEEARARGAMMLFGEKYGNEVRVITLDPDFSVELCGGTHVTATGEIGYFRITSESSVAAGIRRIEAVTGKAADRYLRKEKMLVEKIKSLVGISDDPVAGLEKLISDKKELEKEAEKMRLQNAGMALQGLLNDAEMLSNDIRLIKGEVPGVTMDVLKQLGYESIKKSPENTITVLGSKDEKGGKAYLMVAVTDDVIKKGVKAGQLVGQLAKIIGGGGGGQPSLATAGGRQPENLSKALDEARKVISEKQLI